MARTLTYRDRERARETGKVLTDWRRASVRTTATDWRRKADGSGTVSKGRAGRDGIGSARITGDGRRVVAGCLACGTGECARHDQ